MVFGGLYRILASTAALALLTGIAAATPLKTDVATIQTSEPAVPYAIYHRIEDARTTAMRAALDEAVAQKLIDKGDADSIAAFYDDNAYAMVWIEDGKLSSRAQAIVKRIESAADDGLEPSDYRLPWEGVGLYFTASDRSLANADLILSQAIADYARDAYSGRLVPASISSNFGYETQRLDPADILGLVSSSSDGVATLEAYNPPQREFQALRAELIKARQHTEAESKPQIPDGPLIKAGMSDPRIVVIRERLEIATVVADPALYDEDVVAAVKDFQKSAQLRADGIVGNRTLAAMNQGEVDHASTIIANMERWRWMPRNLGSFYVRVNIPDYNVDIYKDDVVIYTTAVVVGKTSNQTPVFSDEMEHVVVNPVWNVPASIARNEMLPRLRAGSSLGGYKVYVKSRGRFRAVNPRSVNWRNVNMGSVQIKQPPGSSNALGRVKFLFPNKYSVYLHDTPSKSLFERDSRAFSHGCVRVKDPFDFAKALLAFNDEIDASKLPKMVGGGERWLNLDSKIPVHVTYFTAWVDDAGELQFRPDVYGHDKRVLKALGSG